MQKTLPKGWKWVRLGEVCEFVYGDSLPEKKRQVGNVPVFGSNGIVGTHDTPISDGETIIIGRKGSVGEINFYLDSCFPIDTTYFIDKRHTQQNIKWLYWSLKSLKLDSLSLTVGVPGLNRKDAYKVKFPLPPLPTQHKIVDILEEADNLRKLRQQADEKMKDLIPSLFVQMFGDPAINPKEWAVKKLEDVCIKITDGSHRTPKLLDSGYPFFTVTNIKNGNFDFSDIKYISEDDFKDLVKNDCKPLKGDVLFSKDGTIGKVVEVKEEKEIVILSSLAILRPQPNVINSTYLAKIAASDFFVNQAKEKQSGSALRRIILRTLKSVRLPLPPLPLQQEFAKLVEDIEAEKARQSESRKKLDDLFQSLMQRAFTGELVA